MTRTEALEAMENGEKITHEYFDKGEYICIEKGGMVTEEGYDFEDEFDNRVGGIWDEDWSIYIK